MEYNTCTCTSSGMYVSLILTIMHMGTGHIAKQHSLASSHFYLANNPRIAKNAERHQFKQVQILIISSKY